MSPYFLDNIPDFPPVEEADEHGILAVGGDLSPQRLISAYSKGIFPWYSSDEPILWWSPDPRFVLFPADIYISKSMRQVITRNIFSVTIDKAFEQVITNCRKPRKKQKDTWITPDMITAYIRLHELGFAHSVEAWSGNTLAGGLYGVSLGRAFFGESMFSLESNASKTAFIHITQKLKALGFLIIDCQVYTKHLESLGAVNIPRNTFLNILQKSLKSETILGNWGDNTLFNNN